ncbi:hypothetical protein GQ457_16G001020 [Hibiscus cannabinus]
MRGVYFKNMKRQAAIKVDKKQIHLETVGSQEEAARLYDRAAFMCRREPNFELSYKDANTQGIFDACATTVETLSEAGIHAEADLRENYSPGWKYSNWEMKGVSLKNCNEDLLFVGSKAVKRRASECNLKPSSEQENTLLCLVNREQALMFYSIDVDLAANRLQQLPSLPKIGLSSLPQPTIPTVLKPGSLPPLPSIPTCLVHQKLPCQASL